ncbi:hypothetical protein BVG79_p1000041 (plasmid) [Ketogulonicigenium robustum]|uniref:Uncharacterized protein n=1 Tax=Ketogulonicigenium robustum TaxID=92947 RepID=A0A1W6P350_9RHOB|nr:hypothetical protein BVG79_p1000041 [Ketogulonicigenium robustum]
MRPAPCGRAVLDPFSSIFARIWRFVAPFAFGLAAALRSS